MDTTAGLTALTVASVKRETDNAVRVGFNVPNDARAAFRYQPGQYLTLETVIAGVPVRRSYSICSGAMNHAWKSQLNALPVAFFLTMQMTTYA